MNKTTKNKIIILIIVAMFLASVLFYFWNKYAKQGTPAETGEKSSASFPFGNNNGSTNSKIPSNAGGGSHSSPRLETKLPILRQISKTPVAGGISFKKGGLTVIRFVDRGTGHIYETNDLSLENATISNTTIPKVPEAIWSPGGQSVIMRYTKEGLDNIFSFSANITNTTSATSSQGVSKNSKSAFLPSNIEQLSTNQSGDKIFYLINSAEGTVGSISNPDGSQKKIIFQSPIKEWLSSWPNNETVALVTKPSSSAAGYLFFLNTKTGALSKIISGVNGLTALVNSAAKNILYSESVDGSFKLRYRNLINNLDRELSFKTLPEKCVWSKKEVSVAYCAVSGAIASGDYPDDWYQGLISFTDNVWKFDTKTGSSELVFDIQKETDNALDIINPFLSENDDYLFFMNKKDLSFWSINLKKQSGRSRF